LLRSIFALLPTQILPAAGGPRLEHRAKWYSRSDGIAFGVKLPSIGECGERALESGALDADDEAVVELGDVLDFPMHDPLNLLTHASLQLIIGLARCDLADVLDDRVGKAEAGRANVLLYLRPGARAAGVCVTKKNGWFLAHEAPPVGDDQLDL
jgi:hypothetical protein